ncbi:unnamed protein product [Peniophora sp. CBMAI 1063]|nr:unnamed protein product [Peniophora sp. CBMAI 1063]
MSAEGPDYYDLAVENYDLTRVALLHGPPSTAIASLRPEKLSKLRLMTTEYHIWAWRLQQISRKMGDMADASPVRGLRGEMDLVDFGFMNSYYPGFVHEAGEKDVLPPLEEITSQHDAGAPLCRAGGLVSVDSHAWWNTPTIEPEEPVVLEEAARAAEYLLRAPRRLLTGLTPLQCAPDPHPIAAVVDVLGGLNCLQDALQDVVRVAGEDIRRRTGGMIFDRMQLGGRSGLTQDELCMLRDYEATMKTQSITKG